MTDTLQIVTQLGGELIRQLEWAGREVTETVLASVAEVPFESDIHAYLAQLQPVMTVALTTAMGATFDALRAEIAETRARTAALEADFEKFMREFEQFRRMRTSNTIQ